MNNNYDNLQRLFDNIKTIGFWGRVFSWNKIKNQLIDASGELQKLLANIEHLKNRASSLEQINADLSKDLQLANKEVIVKETTILKLNLADQNNTNRLSSIRAELAAANSDITHQQERINQVSNDYKFQVEKIEQLVREHKKELARVKDELINTQKRNTQLEANEEQRKQEHSQQTSTLKNIQDAIQHSRNEEIQEKHSLEIERLNGLKQTWSNHQENVKQAIKTICNKHTIEYVESVSFKGEPDNTLKICNEFIVFDAKSPRGEDLSNFSSYLKDQSEKAKKYAKEENVKKWIFFVVPTNTFEVIKSFVYPLADYDVFIVSLDALEPVILSMKKVEEYEFADKLNPEERENICRVLGKFAHLSKRRIQIDTYFINQFMELAYKCESDLPFDILEKVIEFEKAEKLNPPQEKRIKAISIAELEKTTNKLRNDTRSKGILVEDDKITMGLNQLPLYKAEND